MHEDKVAQSLGLACEGQSRETRIRFLALRIPVDTALIGERRGFAGGALEGKGIERLSGLAGIKISDERILYLLALFAR